MSDFEENLPIDQEPVFSALTGCAEDPPAYSGTGTETGTLISRSLDNGSDDGYFYWDGATGQFKDSDNDIRIGKTIIGGVTDNDYFTWFTFRDVQVPATAVVNKAVLSFVSSPVVESEQDGSFEVMIAGHCGASVTPTNYSEATGIDYCNTSVFWDLEPSWDEDTRYETPDIATVIHDIINHSAWSAGESLTIYINEESGPDAFAFRNLYSYEGGTGFEPILKIWWNNVINITVGSGGLRGGGAAIIPAHHNIIGSGGAVLGGLSDPTIHIVEGGVVAGGSAINGKIYTDSISGGAVIGSSAVTSISISMSGGIVCNGTSLPGGITTYIVESSGVLCGSAAFANGYFRRKVVTIPANREVPKFLIVVRAAIGSEDIRVEDSLGNLVYHDLRSQSETEIIVAFKVNVSSTEDSIYYIYHNEVS